MPCYWQCLGNGIAFEGHESATCQIFAGLGAVVALAACHAQAQGPAAAIRQDVDLGAEAAPTAAAGGICPFVFECARRAHDRTVQQHGGQIQIGLQVDQTRPDASVAPVGIAVIDRFLLAIRGNWCQGAPIRAIQRSASIKKATMRFLSHAYIGTGNQKK